MKSLRIQKRTLHLAGGGYATVLAPADAHSSEVLGELSDDEFDCDIKTKRKSAELREYWAGIGFLVKNYRGPDGATVRLGVSTVDPSVIWPTSRHYHDALMEATGHVSKLWRIDGTYRNVVDSIALDNMEDEDFKAYFETARALTLRIFGWDPFKEWAAAKTAAKFTAPAIENDWRRNWQPGDDDDVR